MRKALTIAGSDSGGGAGIQADLKTFTAFRVYGMSALTAITAQNTLGVQGVHVLPPEFVVAQIRSVLGDIGADAAKTGMLATADIVEAVARELRAFELRALVVDPVMVAASGDPLLDPGAEEAVKQVLLPLALVVTPNLDEAAILAGEKIRDLPGMKEAARAIHALGARHVLVKGGHLPGPRVLDVLYDGQEFIVREGPRIETTNSHGTGCTLSAGIAAGLARGQAVPTAVAAAQAYVAEGLRAAVAIGKGRGPLNHLVGLKGAGFEEDG
ncbi:MAG TPA: bifunctional hydroxymethylpyrimidine kinase/phosphomethylpyrimidine kinase [Candidatus Methylomirabilis sp.]|nr:bifunctional hydroxymethylpyrimidine kinase/phosphomethylpyrimidine kinase [Candidatus Methylomirabilis sp.]